MSRMIRRVAAVAVGLVSLVMFAVWMFYAGDILSRYAWAYLDLPVPLSQAGGPRPDAYDHAAQRYYLVSIALLLLAAGGSTTLLILVPRPGFRQRAWIYLLFLAILLPATWYNYDQHDIVLRASLQTGLNFLLIFLAATTALWLCRLPASDLDAKVLKYMVIFALVLAGVFVPGIFSLVWLFFAGGLLTLEQTREITFQHITGLASVASAVVAWLNYRREQAKLTPDTSPKIVIPGQ